MNFPGFMLMVITGLDLCCFWLLYFNCELVTGHARFYFGHQIHHDVKISTSRRRASQSDTSNVSFPHSRRGPSTKSSCKS